MSRLTPDVVQVTVYHKKDYSTSLYGNAFFGTPMVLSVPPTISYADFVDTLVRRC